MRMMGEQRFHVVLAHPLVAIGYNAGQVDASHVLPSGERAGPPALLAGTALDTCRRSGYRGPAGPAFVVAGAGIVVAELHEDKSPDWPPLFEDGDSSRGRRTPPRRPRMMDRPKNNDRREPTGDLEPGPVVASRIAGPRFMAAPRCSARNPPPPVPTVSPRCDSPP